MAKIIIENVIKTFVIDTLLCSTECHEELRKFMMDKHAWSFMEWSKYFEIYKANIDNIGLIKEDKNN